MADLPIHLEFALPDWVVPHVAAWPRARDDEARMRLVLGLARESVERDDGGPFAAAVFSEERVVAVGINRVLPEKNSLLHAEVLALMLAERHYASHNLGEAGLPQLTLISSCEPCAMCLGAILWGGLRRVVSGALREDAEQAGFDEGPVFPASHRYLEARGIELAHGVLRAEARELFALYRARGGRVY
ncbi:MAG: nucleoside deaminase [Pseudomonadota bacterium]|nr:nucleoside deaminase [Pseudomonadota bacterium]MDP1905268.1 nucleoside deaminase [Pseudomonadota bacterium]MDP2352554.1 nucleoside deaminase [Pseudomonadota bacterium]